MTTTTRFANRNRPTTPLLPIRIRKSRAKWYARMLHRSDWNKPRRWLYPPTYQYPTGKSETMFGKKYLDSNWPMSRALSPPALSEPAAFEELPRGDIPTPQEATAIFRFLTRANRTPAPSL